MLGWVPSRYLDDWLQSLRGQVMYVFFLNWQKCFFCLTKKYIVFYAKQAVVSVGILLAFFYNVVVSWSLWYLVTSLSSLIIPEYKLEWAYCGHSYNSKWCHSNLDDEICLYNNTIALNGTCSIAKNGNYTSSSVKEYWNRKVLGHVGYDWSNFVIFLKNFLRCY